MSEPFSSSRRGLLQSSLAGAATALIAGTLPAFRAAAADAPEVSEDDPTAKALKYVADATRSERTDPTAFCHNCRYYKGAADSPKAPCELFGAKTVNANGWCTAWMKK